MPFSPRVVGEHRADFASMQTILASPQFTGKTGEALVLAIYDYFTSTVHGTYHFWPTDEYSAEPRIRRNVWDPVKNLNCYGWMICGQCSAFLYTLYRAAGFEARQIGVPGHSLCEVKYDGRWHILDVDMWTWFRTPEGHIASAFELAKNAQALVFDNKNKSNPCNLPDRTLKDYTEMYATTKTVDDHVETICPPWQTTGHTMDFHLRPGETLIRSQTKSGRFVLPKSWRDNFAKYAKEWKGEMRERYEPFRTYGNGRLQYAPNLSSRFKDFAAAAWERSGLTQDAQGLVGPGSFTVRMQSPYPFCATPNFTGPEFTYSDGCFLTLAGSGGCTVDVDRPDAPWKTVQNTTAAFDTKLDLSEELQSRYDALIRITLAPGARLSPFAFDSYLMTAPISLPFLKPGANKMKLHAGDKYGLATVPCSHVIDLRSSADPVAQAVSVKNAQNGPYIQGWQVLAPKAAGPVEAVFRFDAPAARTWAWFNAQLTFREAPVQEANRQASVAWSPDGKTWHPAGSVNISHTPLQWDCGLTVEYKLPEAAATVFLKITSDTAISGIEYYGHLLEAAAAGKTAALEIRHRWREGSAERDFTAPVQAAPAPGQPAVAYEVPCGADPRDHTIEMRAPSQPAS